MLVIQAILSGSLEMTPPDNLYIILLCLVLVYTWSSKVRCSLMLMYEYRLDIVNTRYRPISVRGGKLFIYGDLG